MKIGAKFKLEAFKDIEWKVIKEFKVKGINLYLIEPNSFKNTNMMIVNEDKSPVVLDYYKEMGKPELLKEIKIDLYQYYKHPCGDCAYYGVKECMDNMEDCDYVDSDAIIAEKDIESFYK